MSRMNSPKPSSNAAGEVVQMSGYNQSTIKPGFNRCSGQSLDPNQEALPERTAEPAGIGTTVRLIKFK
ncbi:MAG: hypothetical protein ACR2PG_03755 [Hyphomicrobiaceae bacterium]